MKAFVKKNIETDIAGAIVKHHDTSAFKIDVIDGEVKIQPLDDN